MDFIKEFNEIISKDQSWEVGALVSKDGTAYTLGSDSKLIGRIFELISYSIINEIAEKNGYILYPAPKQTIYPDFTLMKSENDNKKIAIDIKTTYRDFNTNNNIKKYGFTLGSYASYIRSETKNICFPYNEYEKHYIIGFIYTRNPKASEGEKIDIKELHKINCPYKDVEFFVQEKYKISGEKPGSGNTENIGSIKTNNIDYFIRGEGPFSELGENIFVEYWSNYPKYRENKEYTSLESFFKWKESKGEKISKYKNIYEIWKKTHKL